MNNFIEAITIFEKFYITFEQITYIKEPKKSLFYILFYRIIFFFTLNLISDSFLMILCAANIKLHQKNNISLNQVKWTYICIQFQDTYLDCKIYKRLYMIIESTSSRSWFYFSEILLECCILNFEAIVTQPILI